VILRCLFASPLPLHFGHGVTMILPLPLQVGHIMTLTNVPKAFLVVLWILPSQLHLGHCLGDVLGAALLPIHTSHFSILSIFKSFSAPFAASSSVISRL